MAQQPEPQPEPQQQVTTDPETLLAAWFSALCNSQSSSWPAGSEVAEVVARTVAALRRGCIPEEDWLSELRGLERAGQLQSFLSSPGAPQPDDDDADEGARSGDCGARSRSTGMTQVRIDNENTRQVTQLGSLGMIPQAAATRPSQPAPAPAPEPAPEPAAATTPAPEPATVEVCTMQFLHVAGPEENYKRTPYGEADNALISDAKARGLPSVRINDVVLPGGNVLRFEVRFQTETSVAGSRRTAQTWGARGSPTGMAQVNIDNENTRIVEPILPHSVSFAVESGLSALFLRGFAHHKKRNHWQKLVWAFGTHTLCCTIGFRGER